MSLLTIEEPDAPARRSAFSAEHPLWRLGFRPFYLLAAALAALAIPLWLAQYQGLLPGWPQAGLSWHMHEMVFGFGIAVIVGFLFTAARNWTGLETPRGARLAALAGVWVAGRIAMLSGAPLLAAAIDLLFLPLAAWPLFQVLHKSGNKRNLFLVGLLAMLTLCNALFHGAVLGWLALSPVQPIQAAILIIVLIESVIGGRVIPMFTSNGAPGVKPVVRERHDRIALAVTAAACLAWIFGLPAALTAALTAAAGCAMLLRVAGWKPHQTLHVPLLWILHLGYAWIPVGFFLLALAAIGVVTASVAFHALAVGSMTGLIIGMITRTTLGHTGRMLKAGRAERVMFALILSGALARVAAGLVPVLRDAALLVSAACWTSAFVLYIVTYAPYLWRARIDGKEG